MVDPFLDRASSELRQAGRDSIEFDLRVQPDDGLAVLRRELVAVRNGVGPAVVRMVNSRGGLLAMTSSWFIAGPLGSSRFIENVEPAPLAAGDVGRTAWTAEFQAGRLRGSQT